MVMSPDLIPALFFGVCSRKGKDCIMGQDSKKAVFYGWKLSFLAAFGIMMLHGGAVYLMNTFMQPFTQMYGWTRGEMGTALGLGSFCGMAAAPLLASLAMRVSVRYIMFAGAIVGGISMFFFSWFTNLRLFTLNFCLLWISGQACGGVVANALMSNWFIRHRGKAFGIVNFGMSLSGAVLPFVALILLTYASARTATAVLGGIVLLFVAPAVWLFVRDTPESMGLTPDGEVPAPIDGKTKPGEGGQEDGPPPTVRELLRSPLVYRIGMAFSLGILAAAGVVGQLKPRFSDLGFSDFTAMAFMCATAFFTACGKYAWGWVCDRIPPIRAARILFIYCCGAYLLSFLPPSALSVGIFAVFCGLGMGGTWTILPAVVVDVFGRAHFMAAYRVVSLFIFFKSFGYIIMGQSYQLTGSYDAAFLVFSALSLVSLLLVPKEGAKYRRVP